MLEKVILSDYILKIIDGILGFWFLNVVGNGDEFREF